MASEVTAFHTSIPLENEVGSWLLDFWFCSLLKAWENQEKMVQLLGPLQSTWET